MDSMEFLKYEQTPGEKHLGVATIRLWKKIILRYKIVLNKDGSGFFPASASLKLAATSDRSETYCPSFMLDSSYEAQTVADFIKFHVKSFINPSEPAFRKPVDMAAIKKELNEINNPYGENQCPF
jgi:hypothetical protein